MGLDIALGAIILVGALRGWFRGFTSQAVRLVSMVACVYLALPVREQVRPYILAKLPAVEPGLLDRMLWWVAAVVSYIALVGLVSLAIQLMKTPPEKGEVVSRRADRVGGLSLGAAKGAVIAAFLAAGVLRYGGELTRNVSWLERQVGGSLALEWTEKYQPVPRLWATAAVRDFVGRIQRHGLRRAADGVSEKQLAERTDVPNASSPRSPRLGLPPAELPAEASRTPDPELAKVEEEIQRLKQELGAARSRLP
jgi:uncharacterized membrane protein required for colicin V production